MEEKSYGRRSKDESGAIMDRYHALDPADQSVWCTCGKDQCPRSRIRPFREHIAELHKVLSGEIDECSLNVEEWSGVLYGLRIAASIDDVSADTSYVDDPRIFEFCEPTIDYTNAQSEMATKYVAGATIFQFLWQAYESVVAASFPQELKKLLEEGKLGERGRRLLEARPEISGRFVGIKALVQLTIFQLQYGGLFESRLTKIEAKFPTNDLIKAAELGREFRNFLFHGEDAVPDHEDWPGDSLLSRCRLYRFYTISRLLLYLIQAFLLLAVELNHNDDLDTVNELTGKLLSLQFSSGD